MFQIIVIWVKLFYIRSLCQKYKEVILFINAQKTLWTKTSSSQDSNPGLKFEQVVKDTHSNHFNNNLIRPNVIRMKNSAPEILSAQAGEKLIDSDLLPIFRNGFRFRSVSGLDGTEKNREKKMFS